MKKTLSRLYESISLLESNDAMSKTTEEMYIPVLDTRACIKVISVERKRELIEFIIPIPPVALGNRAFSALRWNGSEYKFDGMMKSYETRFLKGTARKI